MSNKRTIFIFAVVAMAVVMGVLVYGIYNKTMSTECPDEWIENRMPKVGQESTSRQYFIVDGQRQDVTERDIVWVKEHCSVQPQYVY